VGRIRHSRKCQSLGLHSTGCQERHCNDASTGVADERVQKVDACCPHNGGDGSGMLCGSIREVRLVRKSEPYSEVQKP
jgi:hypothetical protein